MKFIFETDYNVLMKDEIKDLITDSDSTALDRAESMALAQMKQRLSANYDMDTALQTYTSVPDPDNRDPFLVMIAIDLTLYHLYSRVAPQRIPQHRVDRYQDAIDWLKDVSTGKSTADLPLKTDEEGEDIIPIRLSSRYEKEDNKW